LHSSYFPDSPETAWELKRKYNKNVAGISRERTLATPGPHLGHYHTECQYSDWANEMEQPYVEMHPLTALEIGAKEGS